MVNSGLWTASTPSLRKMRPISNTRSSPPTTNRFRYSSVAMRSCIARSSALWWVSKARAVAPVAWLSSVGVSTSTNPRPASSRRSSAIIRALASATFRLSSLTIRSM